MNKKIFVTDHFLNKRNVYGMNGEMLKKINILDETVTIFFIISSCEIKTLDEYLNTLDDFEYTHWKKYFQYLERHTLYFASKEKLTFLFTFLSHIELHYFCKGENIIEGCENIQKFLYFNHFHPYNVDVQNLQITSYVSAHSDNKTNYFEPYTIPDGTPLFDYDKKDRHCKEIFIHVIDENQNLLDKVIMSMASIKVDMQVVLYNPKRETIKKEITVSDTHIENDALVYNYRNTKMIFPIPDNYYALDTNEKMIVTITTNAVENSYINNEKIEKLLNSSCKISSLIDTYIDDDELCSHIYNSDIYIPISNEFCTLSLLAQKYKTYTLFLNDNDVSKEYCIYGKVLTEDTKDMYYNITEKRIEKVLTVRDVTEAIDEYYTNEKNPSFQYKKEIAAMIF